MTTLLRILCLAASFSLAGSLAQAGSYTDNNPANVWLNALNTSYTGTFDVANEGYNPAVETITSAEVEFLLWDLLGSESYSIKFGPETFASGGSFYWFLNLSGSVSGSAFGTLDATGILSYTVYRNSGEFWLKNARLDVETAPRQVPDSGATLALLGIAMAAVAGARRMVRR